MDYSTPGFPSLSPRICSDSCPLSQWCHSTILSMNFDSPVGCFQGLLTSVAGSASIRHCPGVSRSEHTPLCFDLGLYLFTADPGLSPEAWRDHMSSFPLNQPQPAWPPGAGQASPAGLRPLLPLFPHHHLPGRIWRDKLFPAFHERLPCARRELRDSSSSISSKKCLIKISIFEIQRAVHKLTTWWALRYTPGNPSPQSTRRNSSIASEASPALSCHLWQGHLIWDLPS